jgi:hypothetical protein
MIFGKKVCVAKGGTDIVGVYMEVLEMSKRRAGTGRKPHEGQLGIPEPVGVPDGFAEELPEFERRLAYGMSLRANGYSIRKASEMAEVAPRTLYDRWKRAGLPNPDMNRIMREAVLMAHEIVQESGKQTHELLIDGEVSTQQVPIVYGIASDKISRLGQVARSAVSSNVLGTALGRLADVIAGSRVELVIEDGRADAEIRQVSDRVEELVEVEPKA